MARYILDTGIVIRHLRGKKDAVNLLRSLSKRNRLGIATVTRLEIHAGMHPDEAFKTQKLLSRFENFDMDRNVADRAGDYVQSLRARNMSLSVPDAIIGATAVQNQLTLVTLNENDFPMPGISILPLSLDQ